MRLARRELIPEWMDAGRLGAVELETCLRHIAAINRLSGAYRPTLAWLSRLSRPNRPLRLLDIGCGYGDMARRIARWAEGQGRALEILAADLNPRAVRVARAATPPGLPISYACADVFALEEPQDVIISSLFAHHLDHDGVVRFLRWMEAHAAQGWFVNDLHRHALPYRVARLAAAALPVSPIVAHDAPVSVARAFTPADWRRYLDEAGLEDRARLEWFMPFRLCVGRIK